MSYHADFMPLPMIYKVRGISLTGLATILANSLN